MISSRRCSATIALAIAASILVRDARAQTAADAACYSANEQAVALRKTAKLIDEGKALATCAAPNCPDVVKASCQQRLEELNKSLPRIVFDIKDASGKDIPDVRLTVDKTTQANANTAVTLDPGDHEFRFEVTGQDPVVKHFVLRENQQDRREPIVIGSAVGTAPPQPLPGPATTPSDATSPMTTIGLVVGGAGVVGLVVGGIFGGLTISSSGSASSECPSHTGCSAQATSDRSNALTYGTVSTVAFIAGGVLVAGGLTLYFTAPKAQAPSVGVQMTPGGLAMTGRF